MVNRTHSPKLYMEYQKIDLENEIEMSKHDFHNI